MQKHEFIQHINELGNPMRIEDLPDEEYRIIEHVYNYHPVIENKDDIARLYCMRGGFHIISDMTQTADEWMRKEEEVRKLREKRTKLYEEIDKIEKELRKIQDERNYVSTH